jgi:nucleoside-diphosphate-sugar epimerase
MPSRRSFLKLTAAFGGAAGFGALPNLAFGATNTEGHVERAKKPLKILILGGTGFTGPEQVEYAIARGHEVTLINRNKTRPDFFKGRVEQLVGDMNGDMSALAGRKFDVVIDNPTTLPAWVRNVAQYMKGNTSQYIFISTISVYPDSSKPGADESDGLTPLPEGLDPYTVPPADARKHYGALKTYSEGEVAKHYPGIHTIIRPGLIVGPLDATDRFTYWPYRIDKGGEVLAPGDGNDPVQFIDSRDLAEWTIRMAENREFGIYNGTGPEKPMTMSEMLNGIKAAIGSNAAFTWVPAPFLTGQKISGWRHMTVWVAPRANNAGWSRRSIKHALSKGLTFRPLAVTARETLAWNKTRPPEQLAALAQGAVGGISAQRESEVLDAWKAERSRSHGGSGR